MEEKEPKKYEIGFLIREENDKETISALLKKYGAEILAEEKENKIRLAYPIKKENFAYFGWIHFSLNPLIVKELREQLKLNLRVLRFVIVVLTPQMLAAGQEKKRVFGQRPRREAPLKEKFGEKSERRAPEAPVKYVSQAVDNELLEKKLEEILK